MAYSISRQITQRMSDSVECHVCGGTGFSGRGTGYDDVCSECGGLQYFPVPDDEAEKDAANVR